MQSPAWADRWGLEPVVTLIRCLHGAVTSPHHPYILILYSGLFSIRTGIIQQMWNKTHGKYIKQPTRCWQMGLVVIQHDDNLRLYGHDLVPCAHGCHGTLPCLRWSCLPGSTWRCSFSGTTHLALLNELSLVGTFRALARMLGHICCKLCPLHLYADTDAPKKKWEYGSTTSVSLFSAMTQFQTLNLPWAFDLEPNALESPDFKLITACQGLLRLGHVEDQWMALSHPCCGTGCCWLPCLRERSCWGPSQRFMIYACYELYNLNIMAVPVGTLQDLFHLLHGRLLGDDLSHVFFDQRCIRH